MDEQEAKQAVTDTRIYSIFTKISKLFPVLAVVVLVALRSHGSDAVFMQPMMSDFTCHP